MIDPPKVMGSRLKALRQTLGFRTQVEFAAAIGVDKSTYNPWEKGARPLTFEGACLIRERFSIPLDFLFYGSLVGLPAETRERILKDMAA